MHIGYRHVISESRSGELHLDIVLFEHMYVYIIYETFILYTYHTLSYMVQCLTAFHVHNFRDTVRTVQIAAHCDKYQEDTSPHFCSLEMLELEV